jgi:cytochrome c peroxidase
MRSTNVIVQSALLLTAGLLVGCQDQTEVAGVEGTQEAIVIPGQTPGASLIGSTEVAQAQHCQMSDILAITNALQRFQAAFDCGDHLFSDKFNEIDGSGANVGDGRRYTRFPRADLNGTGAWFNHTPARATGPNAQSCSDCHNRPFDDGGGDISSDAVRDPERLANLAHFIERQTPALFGLGAEQRLAEEMTVALQASIATARTNAVRTGTVQNINLTAKGVSFGTLGVAPVAANDITDGVVGIDTDFVVKPFEWKGVVTFVRDFVRGAGHNELGMQGVEIAGVGVDGDFDGVANELGYGDIGTLAAYMATQARPVRLTELAAAGLITSTVAPPGLPTLTAADIASINRGSTLFTSTGCATCHIPSLTLNNPMFTEPSQVAAYRDATFAGGVNPVSVGVDPANPIRANLITDIVDNMNIALPNGGTASFGGLESNGAGGAIVRIFSDLKRHDMGPGLAEPVGENGVASNVFMTRGLWGVGVTAPYMHDGRATTLMSAILEHGGEATTARNNAQALSAGSQTDLVNFLKNLVLLDPENNTAVTGGNGGGNGGGGAVTATIATQTDWGAGYCQVLTVTNNTTATVAAWSVVVNIGASTITQLWNGTFSPSTGTVTISSQFAWQALAPGANTAQTGFCANRNVANNGAIGSVVSASGH